MRINKWDWKNIVSAAAVDSAQQPFSLQLTISKRSMWRISRWKFRVARGFYVD